MRHLFTYCFIDILNAGECNLKRVFPRYCRLVRILEDTVMFYQCMNWNNHNSIVIGRVMCRRIFI